MAFQHLMNLTMTTFVPSLRRVSLHASRKSQLSLCEGIFNSHGFTFCVFRRCVSSLRQPAIHKLDPKKSSHELSLCHMEGAQQSLNLAKDNVKNRRHLFQTHPCYQYSPPSKGVKTKVTTKNINVKKKKAAKEFTFKGKIGDHDTSIKLAKIQGLLDKGRVVEITVQHDSQTDNSEQNIKAYVAGMQKKFQDSLQNFSTLRMEFSSTNRSKFTIIPIERVDEVEEKTAFVKEIKSTPGRDDESDFGSKPNSAPNRDKNHT